MTDKEKIDQYKQLAAAIYQAAGAYDMPTRALDALRAAANGEEFTADGILPVYAPVSADPEGACKEEAYSKMDRFLRLNLDDEDYAEYSKYLDDVYTAHVATQAQQDATLDLRIAADLAVIVETLDEGEWAEHIAKTDLGQRLERHITQLVGKQPDAAQEKPPVSQPAISFMQIAQKGFDAWAGKEHNRRWVKKIDGTPIPNDLVVCIADAFQEARAALAQRDAALSGESNAK